MKRMYFTPAWMFGSILVMSPTFSSLPVVGITCITPIAPTGLFDVLIERGFLVALRRHQQVVQLVPLAVLLEQLDHRLQLAALGLGRRVLRELACSRDTASR